MAKEDPLFVPGIDDAPLPADINSGELERVAQLLNGAKDQMQVSCFCNPPEATDRSNPARTLLDQRRERDDLFGSGLFGEPAWVILLELYCAHVDGRATSISSLCLGSGIQPVEAFERINQLAERGLIVRVEDKRGRRQNQIQLAPETFQKLGLLIEGWRWRSIIAESRKDPASP